MIDELPILSVGIPQRDGGRHRDIHPVDGHVDGDIFGTLYHDQIRGFLALWVANAGGEVERLHGRTRARGEGGKHGQTGRRDCHHPADINPSERVILNDAHELLIFADGIGCQQRSHRDDGRAGRVGIRLGASL